MTLKREIEELNGKLKELSEDELKSVTGGLRENGVLRLIDYDEEVSNMILSKRDAEAGYRKDFEDHYIVLTEVKRKFLPDKYGRLTILDNMSIRYTVYALDDTKIKDGYISDFIM